MSYFMTITGKPQYREIENELQFVPIRETQAYTSSLAAELERLDGKPIYLVDDGCTGTSDEIIMEAKYLLREDELINNTLLNSLLMHFFSVGMSFRIWLADNDMKAFITNSEEVSSYEETLLALKNKCGAWWHSRSN